MTEYQTTTNYLFKLERFGIKLGLDNINALLDYLDHPHKKWQSIHIAGTNGKGSTTAILESILMDAGLNVGAYTSPHLVDFTERIRINRIPIKEKDVIEFTNRMKPVIESITPSFFEVATAMAFWHFARENIDLAIIEVGMGGRLDSTNVIFPVATIINSIGYDHQFYLGSTISEIAREKAGIIKKNVPCFTNNSESQVLEELEDRCAELESRLYNIRENCEYKIHKSDLQRTSFDLTCQGVRFTNLWLNLLGEYQVENAALAVTSLLHLSEKFRINEENIRQGLTQVVWKGRIDYICKEPNIIIDVSHNTSGIEKTLTFLKRFFPKDKTFIITFLQEDKDFKKIGELLAYHAQEIYIIDLHYGKPVNLKIFQNTIQNLNGRSKILASFDAVAKLIKEDNDFNKLWLIIGSHYLAGEAYEKLQWS
jgi:dihydrofolate synthase/folylpolyglutamate synthase